MGIINCVSCETKQYIKRINSFGAKCEKVEPSLEASFEEDYVEYNDEDMHSMNLDDENCCDSEEIEEYIEYEY